MSHHAFLITGVGVFFAVGIAAQKAVPVEYQGRWVPAKAACESSLGVTVAADRVTFVNGKDSEVIGDAEMAGPGFWGPDYRGIMAVLLTEFNGQQPATISFNFGEKKGIAQVDYSPVMPGVANALQKEYNARIQKLSLAKRFPLDKVPLRKCTA